MSYVLCQFRCLSYWLREKYQIFSFLCDHCCFLNGFLKLIIFCLDGKSLTAYSHFFDFEQQNVRSWFVWFLGLSTLEFDISNLLVSFHFPFCFWYSNSVQLVCCHSTVIWARIIFMVISHTNFHQTQFTCKPFFYLFHMCITRSAI